MSTSLTVFALSAMLIASIGMSPVFGQIMEPIVVSTDKASYADGETIVVSGEVREILSGFPVSLQVIAANGNLVTIQQLDVGADKKFGTELMAGGGLWKSSGAYTIKVLYGTESRSAQTMFDFAGIGSTPSIPKSPSAKVGGTDMTVNYKITGGSVSSISADDQSKSVTVMITSTDDGMLTITLPRALIDAKIGNEDDEFFVLVDGEEVEFEETTTANDRTLMIPFSAGSEEIEIIGTFAIPEFGAIAALILAVAIISIIAVSAKTRLSIMPKY